jgi:hypothetical protein
MGRKKKSLSGDQVRWVKSWGYILRALSNGLNSINSDYAGVANLVATDPAKKKRLEAHAKGARWIHHYDWPIWTHIAYGVWSVTQPSKLLHWFRPGTFASLLGAMHDRHEELPVEFRDQDLGLTPRILSVVYSLTAQGRAVLTTRRTMTQLLAKAKQGDNDALFEAIRIDPAVLGSKIFAERIQYAIAVFDDTFVPKIRNALDSRLTEEKGLDRLHLALLLISAAGQYGRLDRLVSAELFIRETGLYAEAGREQPEESLWTEVKRWHRNTWTKFEREKSRK